MVFVLVVIVTMNFNDHWSTIDATPSTPVVKRVETVGSKRSTVDAARSGAGAITALPPGHGSPAGRGADLSSDGLLK